MGTGKEKKKSLGARKGQDRRRVQINGEKRKERVRKRR